MFMKPRQSTLSDTKANPLKGFVGVFLGVLMIVFGLFTIGIVIGIFAIIGGIGLILAGIYNFGGYQTGNCPYCENEVTLHVNAKTCKCPHCGKVSTHKGSYLITID